MALRVLGSCPLAPSELRSAVVRNSASSAERSKDSACSRALAICSRQVFSSMLVFSALVFSAAFGSASDVAPVFGVADFTASPTFLEDPSTVVTGVSVVLPVLVVATSSVVSLGVLLRPSVCCALADDAHINKAIAKAKANKPQRRFIRISKILLVKVNYGGAERFQ